MKKVTKKWKIVLISLLCVVFVAGILALVVPHDFMSIFEGEDYVLSHDGKYGYVQLSSPKKGICTVFVRTCDTADSSTRSTQAQVLGRIFNEWDMDNISWGIQTYDLFFETPEAGPFMYKFDETYKQWLGPLYFDDFATKTKREQGDKTTYCFNIGTDANIELFSHYDVFDIIEIEKKTIPRGFLRMLD